MTEKGKKIKGNLKKKKKSFTHFQIYARGNHESFKGQKNKDNIV